MTQDRLLSEYTEAYHAYRNAVRVQGLDAIEPTPPIPLIPAESHPGATPSISGYATGFGVSTRRGSGYLRELVLKLFFYTSRQVVKALHGGVRYRFSGMEVEPNALPVQITVGPRRVSADLVASQLQHALPTILGGASIGPLEHRLRGTLGCFVRPAEGRDEAKLYVLSNAHVLSKAGLLGPGTMITHPGWEDVRPTVDQVFARFERAASLTFSTGESPKPNTVDAALALVDQGFDRVDPGRIANVERYDPTLANLVEPRTMVMKCGRSTGYTEGVVESWVESVWADYTSGTLARLACFKQVFRVVGLDGQKFAAVGDSGAVILEMSTGRPVGLLFAVNPKDGSAVACHFRTVCHELGVKPVAV